MKLKNLLKENPDTVNYNMKELGFRNDDAYAFGFYKGDAYVGDPRAAHNQMGRDLNDRGEISDREYETFPEGRFEMKHAGRFWLKHKIISFWDYPTQNQMKGVISKLEKVTGKKIWKNGWKLEVIDKGGKIYRPTKSEREGWGWNKNELHAEVKLIPVEDYVGSQKQVGKEISHNVSPLLKKKGKEVPKGIGSRKKVKGAKKGETPAETRDRLRKGLGDGVIRLKDLIKEIFILYEDQSAELVKIARGQNGLIDPKGNAYYVPAISHIDFLVKQPKFRSFKKRLDHALSDEYATLYEAIMTEAMSDGWVRISGNKKELGFMATKKTLMRNKKLIDDIIIFVESVVKRPIKVYRSEFMIRKPQKINYNKDFGND